MKKRSPIWHPWRWRILVLGVGFFMLLGWLRFSASLLPPAIASSSSDMPMPETAQLSVMKPENPAATPMKIAFLFLARNRMPLDVLWDLFFKGVEEHLYSIHIHPRPGFVYDSSTTSSKFFWNRQINNSVQVEWGEASMIDAERNLLRKALDDTSVSHFVLLSDSCIPLYSFKIIYEYITSSAKSFVDSFSESKNTRYNAHMFPTITQDKWRKGSQWFVLVRDHAEIVVTDEQILQTFYKYCKRFSQLMHKARQAQLQRDVVPESGRKYGSIVSEKDCVPDEHYIATLLAIKGVEDEIERRTLTYTLWKASDRGRQTDRWHPVTFNFVDASEKLIREIQGIRSIKYETEDRTEWCSSNGRPGACYLFARKFSRSAALRLVRNNETFSFAGSVLAISSLNV